MKLDPYFGDAGVANAAKRLRVASEALGELESARTKLAAIDFVDLASEVEQIRMKLLRAVKEVLP